MKVNYYECEMTNAKDPDWGTYSICIKALRKPTRKEAKFFLARDMAALGVDSSKCLSVMPLTYEEAHDGSFDMSQEANFPVFGA